MPDNRRETTLQRFVDNITARGVHRDKDGGFHISIEKGKVQPISLNPIMARAIIYPATAEFFEYDEGLVPFPDIFDGVYDNTPYPELFPDDLQRLLRTSSRQTSKLEISKLIFHHLAHMFKIARMDLPRLIPGKSQSSTDVADYRFGMNDDEISKYQYHADCFHRLMLFLHGNVFTGYEMKLVDVVPILMKTTPFRGVMRLVTEQGEHSHYEDMRTFYQKSTRGGGGPNKIDPILWLFELQWRRIRLRIRSVPMHVQEAFEEYVHEKLEIYDAAERIDHLVETEDDDDRQHDQAIIEQTAGARTTANDEEEPWPKVVYWELTELHTHIMTNLHHFTIK